MIRLVRVDHSHTPPTDCCRQIQKKFRRGSIEIQNKNKSVTNKKNDETKPKNQTIKSDHAPEQTVWQKE